MKTPAFRREGSTIHNLPNQVHSIPVYGQRVRSLARQPRYIVYIFLAWAFLFPSVHFYLGQFEVISGAYGVTPAGLIDFAMFLFGAAVLALCLLRKRVAPPFLFFSVMLYLFASFYTVLISPNPVVGIRGVVVNAVPYVFFLDLVMLTRSLNLSKVCARVAIFSAIIPMTIACLQILASVSAPIKQVMTILPADEYSLQPYPGLGISRVTGTFFSYNPFAVFLAITFWGVFLELQGKLHPFLRWFFLTLSGLLLFSTFTRAVWFAVLTSAGVVVFFAKSRVRLALITVAIVGGLGVIASPLSGMISTRFADATSLEQRSDLASFGWQLFLEQPLGYGAGASRLFTAQLDWSASFTLRGDLVGGYAFHNEYITAAVEGGVLLLGTTILLLASLFLLGWRVYVLARWNLGSRRWGIWLIAATLILVQLGLTDSGLSYAGFAYWILVAGVEMEYRALRRIAATRRKRADGQRVWHEASVQANS